MFLFIIKFAFKVTIFFPTILHFSPQKLLFNYFFHFVQPDLCVLVPLHVFFRIMTATFLMEKINRMSIFSPRQFFPFLSTSHRFFMLLAGFPNLYLQFFSLFIGLNFQFSLFNFQLSTKNVLFILIPDKKAHFSLFFAFFVHFIEIPRFFIKTL